MGGMRVLSWNLFHGRAVPDEPRELLDEFAAMLAGWPWDVALLQECPPWWPAPLAGACDARAFAALTSRNQLSAVRRALARRRPDVMRSSGGGCNAILVRGCAVTAHARLRLRAWPERRVLHAVRLADGRATWLANLHASAHDERRARRDLDRAAATVLRWAAGAPAVVGGDMNTRTPTLVGFEHAGGHVLDHVFARGLRVVETARTLSRRCEALAANLSDHRPVIARLKR